MKTILFLLACYSSTLAFSGQIGLELIPRGRPFRLTPVDPREIQMMLSFEGDSKVNASIGNYFSIFGIRPAEDSEWMIHFGLEGAGFFSMRQAENRFPLETADGLIGTYIEGANGPLQLQLRFTHISAHLADGSSGTAIPYSREFTTLRAGYVLSEELFFYGGIQYLVNTVPKVHPWSLQGGANYFLPLGSTKFAPFAGLDLKWKEEASHNPSFGVKVGMALNNPPEAYRSFRFFYSYFTGTDPRGQFFDRTFTAHSLGVEMQI